MSDHPLPEYDALSLRAVEDYLASRLPGLRGPLRATKFQTGQSNPTFLLQDAENKYVLRRKPPGNLLKSAHAVDREYRVQKALIHSDVPVPRMLLFCDDRSVIGSEFYVMEHVDGHVFTEPTLPGVDKSTRSSIFDTFSATLAKLHNLDIDALGLSDYGPSGNYVERQISRWSGQYRASETSTIPSMDALLQALPAAMPDDDGQRTLVHGDYRIDNVIFARDRTECVAVLDWELSTIGHPYADLAAVIMQWQLPPGQEGRGLSGVDRKALGIPSDEAFIEAYCMRRGLERVENFEFYLSFAFFRMAAILQGVHKRALDGNASDPEHAHKLGAYVPRFAALGLEALERNAR